MRFTADQAYEAHQEGEPIIITRAAAMHIIGQHDCEGWEQFLADNAGAGIGHDTFDAWHVLSWLGY